MRASLYLVGFAVASMAGAGLVGMGCSSSSSGGTPTPTPEAGTTTDDSGSTGDGNDNTGDTGTVACTPLMAGVSVETLDGGAQWSCLQTHCMSQLTACAADCTCNNSVLKALLCTASDAGMSAAQCFGTVANDSPTLGGAALMCLGVEIMNSGHCPNAPTGDGGPKTDGGDAGTTADTGTPADAGAPGDATGQ